MSTNIKPLKSLSGDEQVAFYHARERRGAAQDAIAFDADIASPFDMGTEASILDTPVALTTDYPIPKDGWIGVSFSAPVTAGELTIASNGGRTLGTPTLVADQIHRLGKFNRSLLLLPSGTNLVGTVTLHVFDEWFRPNAVATGVWT